MGTRSKILQTNSHDIKVRFVKDGWFSGKNVIIVSDGGSMERPLLAMFSKHLKHTAKKRVLVFTSVLLCLDGNASQNCTAWLEQYVHNGIETVVNVAITSHFFQSCNQGIKKKSNELMRELREEFCHQRNVDTIKVNFDIACAVFAWENLQTSRKNRCFRQLEHVSSRETLWNGSKLKTRVETRELQLNRRR